MLDLLYAQTARARRRWYERHPQARRRLTRPVLSVGNLSVGGTGKTPLVARLAAWLIERGERPAILSRGYGRAERSDGAVVVSDGARVLVDIERAGDEPLMLARAVTGAVVVVAEDRHLAGAIAERRLGATVHILDDGFQHVQLARDFDVLMTTPGEVTTGRVLPFGRLRESADAAARADLVVVLGTDLAGARAEAWTLGVSQAVGGRRVIGAEGAEGALIAVAGIAHPDQFFQLLREGGRRIVHTMAFGDHHRYQARDIERIREAVRACGAHGVVTTEKDAMRLERLAPYPFPLVVATMRLELDGWEVLTASVEAALARAREAA